MADHADPAGNGAGGVGLVRAVVGGGQVQPEGGASAAQVQPEGGASAAQVQPEDRASAAHILSSRACFSRATRARGAKRVGRVRAAGRAGRAAQILSCRASVSRTTRARGAKHCAADTVRPPHSGCSGSAPVLGSRTTFGTPEGVRVLRSGAGVAVCVPTRGRPRLLQCVMRWTQAQFGWHRSVPCRRHRTPGCCPSTSWSSW